MTLRTLLATGLLVGLTATTLAASVSSGATGRARSVSRSAAGGSSSPGAVTGISGGEQRACAVLENGSVACWGGWGGFGTGSSPAPVGAISNAVSISASAATTCAVLSTGVIDCWGYNGSGQLGSGTLAGSDTPVAVEGIDNASSVSTSGYTVGHTCAVLRSGALECWGDDEWGELGDGTTNTTSVPVQVKGIDNAVTVSAGPYDTCALLSSGSVECWGDNAYGQLGDGIANHGDGMNSGHDDYSPTSVRVSGITNAVSVSVGSLHACAALSTGSVECWGDNYYGQLGDGTNADRSMPVLVSGIANGSSVSAGQFHSCAVLASGGIQCWGSNSYGQLGNGHRDATAIVSTPVQVTGIGNAVAVAAGDAFSCAILSDGTVETWGQKLYGLVPTLGQPPGSPFDLIPVVVPIPSD